MGNTRFVHQRDDLFGRSLLVSDLRVGVTVGEETSNFRDSGSQLTPMLVMQLYNAEACYTYSRKVRPHVNNGVLGRFGCHSVAHTTCERIKSEQRLEIYGYLLNGNLGSL